MQINNINPLSPNRLEQTPNISGQSTKNTVSFSEYLSESMDKVSLLEKQADEYNLKLATGELDNIHEVMIAAQKADIALQLTMQIRNKILDAYKEIMRMQI